MTSRPLMLLLPCLMLLTSATVSAACSGSISKRFSFQKNVNDISLDKWRTTCVSDDGKVVEFES
ncbi:hypothetical protein [Parasutterella sp.]|uniref:hypothetical protein n=1 Tax=Parasutterella sp. TaxID=2049037 RepID=UPI003AB4CC9B